MVVITNVGRLKSNSLQRK